MPCVQWGGSLQPPLKCVLLVTAVWGWGSSAQLRQGHCPEYPLCLASAASDPFRPGFHRGRRTKRPPSWPPCRHWGWENFGPQCLAPAGYEAGSGPPVWGLVPAAERFNHLLSYPSCLRAPCLHGVCACLFPPTPAWRCPQIKELFPALCFMSCVLGCVWTCGR